MTECPSCALEIDNTEETCPYCGYEIPRQKSSVGYIAILVIILMLWPLFKLISHLAG